ncbi:MAG: alpha/beta hydrolase, partial [Acidimicrobiia bacterium]
IGLPAQGTDPTRIAAIGAGKPVLHTTGEADPVSGGGATVRVLEQSYRDAGLVVTARYYPDARHELLNELNRDEVLADVVGWVEAVVGVS